MAQLSPEEMARLSAFAFPAGGGVQASAPPAPPAGSTGDMVADMQARMRGASQDFSMSPTGNTANAHTMMPGQAQGGYGRSEPDTVGYRPAPPPAADEGPYHPPPPAPAVLVGKVPAHFDPTTRSTQTTEGVQLTPGTREGMAGATAARAQGMQAEQQGESEKRKAEALQTYIEGNIRAREQDEDARRAAYQQARVQDQGQKIGALVQNIPRQVDPDRLWHNKSLASKIAAGVGLALGGFVSGFRGGPNQALEQLNREIDRDIEAQRQALLEGHQKVEDAKGVYAMMRQEGLDDQQAVTAARMAGRELRANEYKAQLAQFDDPIAKARGQQALAALAREQANDQVELDKLTSARVVHSGSEQYVPEKSIYAGGGSSGPSEKELRAHEWELIQKGATPADAAAATRFWATGQGRGGGVALPGHGNARNGAMTPERATKLSNLDSALADAEDVYKRGSIYANTPEGRARLDADSALAAESYQGAMSGSNRQNQTGVEIAHQLFGGGETVRGDFSGRNSATLGAVRRQIADIRRTAGPPGEGAAPAPDEPDDFEEAR